MLSRAFGREGEDEVLGLFKQLQWISSSLSPVLPLLHSSPRYAKENRVIPKSAIYHSAAESHCRTEPAHNLESKKRDVFRWGLKRTGKTGTSSKGEQEEKWRGKHWKEKGQIWLGCKQSQLGQSRWKFLSFVAGWGVLLLPPVTRGSCHSWLAPPANKAAAGSFFVPIQYSSLGTQCLWNLIQATVKKFGTL